MKIVKYIPFLLLLVFACQDSNDIPFAGRNTFMVFYESDQNLTSVGAKELPDGFLILSNKTSTSGNSGLLTKTDKSGIILWQTQLDNAVFKTFAIGPDGYIVAGDSIKINASDTIPVSDLIISSIIVYKVNQSGAIINKKVIADVQSTQNYTDFHSNAMTFKSADEIILLGTYEEGTTQATVKPFVTALNPSTLGIEWQQNYNSITRDYINSRSVHATNTGHIVWASGVLREQGDFSNSYLSIPFIKEESVFQNNDLLGETSDQRYTASDIQFNALPAFGFGVIGSYAGTNGLNSNFFFSRVDNSGNFIQSTIKYFDGASSSVVVDKATSISEDEGQAIAATADGGFVLAGTMQTTPAFGNGGKDILVIKIDAAGNLLWRNYFGGGGDESVSSVVETSDGGLLLCGTRVLGGLGSTFIMKLNSDGELKD